MRTSTTVNAGSMADIAFLMLIFFLTTTTIETDKGLSQTLPERCKTEDCAADIAARNLLAIRVNSSGSYLVNEVETPSKELITTITDFVTNEESSNEKPAAIKNAVISLKISRELNYDAYVKVLDAIKQAYAQMRTAYSKQEFAKTPSELNEWERKKVFEELPLNLAESNINLVP